MANVRLTLAPERFTKEPLGYYRFSSLRIGQEQHVPDSSNHSLYLINLFSFSNLERNFVGNQLWDGSICLSPSSLSSTTTTATTTTTTTTTTQSHTTHGNRHREREREREDRERGEGEKRRSPSQACFTIFQVLTCVYIHTDVPTDIYTDTHMHTYTHRYTYKHRYTYTCTFSCTFYICYHESSKTRQHSKWNCVGAHRPQHLHMYSLIACN